MSSIINDILEKIRPAVNSFGHWNVVVTTNPEQIKGELGQLAGWHQWDAKYESVANLIREYLSARGMKIADSDLRGGTHVCVFKTDDPQLECALEQAEQA